ncbi:MAG: fluoride efflux transporter CrcB [Alphaproteobacteria bacterium]|nr:fluoride efflux transporter CrcB [Alphaproteobacteria bacterium]
MSTIPLYIAVAVGGALGSVGRFAMMNACGRWWGVEYPYGTLAVNVAGAFAMGILVGLFAAFASVGQEVRAFFAVGVLGGFTTFSTFSLDMVTLFQRGEVFAAVVYAAASVLLTLFALYLGLALTRMLAA